MQTFRSREPPWLRQQLDLGWPKNLLGRLGRERNFCTWSLAFLRSRRRGAGAWFSACPVSWVSLRIKQYLGLCVRFHSIFFTVVGIVFRSSDPVTAERLMDEVRIVVNDSFSPRLSPEHLFVMILNGDEEGALAWASGNFVTKRLLPDNNTLLDSQHETYGSLDLGGSSTQIAFASSSTSTPANFELTFFGVQYHLYSKSFSCRGKGEAVRILKAETVINSSMSRSNVIINPCLPLGAVTNETHSDLFGAQCTMYLRKPAKSRPYYTFEGTGNITQCRRATRTLFQNPDCPFSDPECSFSTRHKINVTTSFMVRKSGHP